jgi:hypothetical protein
MLSEELNIDSDDEINLEIEGETVRVKNGATKCRKERMRAKQVLLHDGEWEDVTIGDYAYGKMIPPNKAIGPLKGQESTWGDKTYIEKEFQKNESKVVLKRKIIFETYNSPPPKKTMKWGIRFFLFGRDTGYVHSIITNYGKLTGDVCNLP